MSGGPAWWRDAVVYQIYPRSFADADGDGVGDLDGVTARLRHVAALGVDAVWLTPFQRSPQADHGYDVSDYCAVDPLFGDLAALDRLLTRAHGLGLRVVVDLVPNHCSSAHPLFAAALAAGPGSRERARFHFAPGRGEQPPNNWPSVFGGPAWSRVPDGEWYLHLFAPEQPDWNWRDPRTAAFFDGVLRFWFDRGCDGVRIDVAHGLFKEPGLRDLTRAELAAAEPGRLRAIPPACDQEEVHAVYRRWRVIADAHDPPAALVGEVNLDPARAARYVRPGELHQAFAFGFLTAPWDAAEWARIGAELLATRVVGGGAATWVVENHDVVRTPTRYVPSPGQGGSAADGESCVAAPECGVPVREARARAQNSCAPVQDSCALARDSRRGAARARAALLAVLGLPGAAYLYQGQELGLPEVDVPQSARQDPAWTRSGHSRDGCRVPLPWRRDPAGAYGFSPPGGAPPWLPVPQEWGAYSVEAAELDPESTLHLCRAALALRRRLHDERVLIADDDVVWHVDGGRLVARRGTFALVVAMGDDAVPLPAGEVLLATTPAVAGRLPVDAAAWVRLPG